MALIFSLYARCSDTGAAAALCEHFDGLQWTLADGTETTIVAALYSTVRPNAPPGTCDRHCWVTPTNISTSGLRDSADAIQMTELGERLFEHLRSAPPYEIALVGIEVDQDRDDDEYVEMVRDGWTGLVVSEAIWQRAGAPVVYEPFGTAGYWQPYTGEWMRWPRHVPDLEVVRCLGCDEPIRTHELVRHDQHGESPCCIWHPYHVWCIRDAPPRAREIMECSDCGEAFELDQLRAMMRWTAASIHHLHLRTIGVAAPFAVSERPDTFAGRPPGISKIAVRTVGEPNTLSPHERAELVHEACPTDDPWRLRLRDAPRDEELRRVYADHLEQSGDLARAELVRAFLVVPATDEAARAHASHLEALAVEMPRGWLRDVCRR